MELEPGMVVAPSEPDYYVIVEYPDGSDEISPLASVGTVTILGRFVTRKYKYSSSGGVMVLVVLSTAGIIGLVTSSAWLPQWTLVV